LDKFNLDLMICQNARKKVENFNKNKYYDKIINIYNSLILANIK